MTAKRRLVVLWPRFGPYHLARLRTLANVCHVRHWELVALETAALDDQYAWQQEAQAEEAFVRRCLFPGESFHSVAPRRMEKRMREVLEELQPEAVAIHSYAFPDSRAALRWCRHRRRTAVLMYDSRAEDTTRYTWREAFKRHLVQQYDAALTAGAPQRRYLEALGMPPDTIFEGYDVVDNDGFAQAASASRLRTADSALPGLQSARPFFLASNRFIQRKNLAFLLDAFAGYLARCHAAGVSPWRLVMLGDGMLGPELQAHARLRGLEPHVVWAGFQQIDALPAYYARASAFVHPPLAEQWGLVVNEAMACGLPVLVSTGAGCVEDLVQHGQNGFVFSPTDQDALSQYLFRTAHETPSLVTLGARSQEIISEWTLGRFASSMLDACDRGRTRTDRGLNPVVALGLWGLRTFARDVSSFQTGEA